MKKIIYILLAVVAIIACQKEPVNTPDKPVNPDDEKPTENEDFALGLWGFSRVQGLNDDGSIYDIDEKIEEYEKLLRQGGLTDEESTKIAYELPRLKEAYTVYPILQFDIQEDGKGELVYTTGEYGPFPLEWRNEDESTFWLTYGGYFSYYIRLDSNMVTGYYLTRDCDPEGPNLKVYVKKIEEE